MKKRLNVIVLVTEIAAISILHAVKLRHSEKENQYKESITAAQLASLKQSTTRVKPPYIFIKMVK